MADCRNCFFYSEEQDRFRQEYNDVLVNGVDTNEQHFCDMFAPISAGVFDGEKDCPKYLPVNE